MCDFHIPSARCRRGRSELRPHSQTQSWITVCSSRLNYVTLDKFLRQLRRSQGRVVSHEVMIDREGGSIS